MRSNSLRLLEIFLALTTLAVGGPGEAGAGPSLPGQEGAGGCRACHPPLNALLPSAHPAVAAEEIRACLACHGEAGPAFAFDWAVHLHHYASPRFTGDCWSCHALDPSGRFRLLGGGARAEGPIARGVPETMTRYFLSWATSPFLDRRHAEERATCRSCHGSFFPTGRASDESCLGCHQGYEAVAALTATREPNPHASHLGRMRCTLCHRAHGESVLQCNRCHAFDLETPLPKGGGAKDVTRPPAP